MPLIDAIEKHTFTILEGAVEPATNAHLLLSSFGGGSITDSSNVVPFITRHATGGGALNDWDSCCFSAYFSNGTDNVGGTSHIHVSRDLSQTDGDFEIDITLVKFNSAAVLVQLGNWWATSEHNIAPDRTDTLGTNVDSAKSFIITNHKQASGSTWDMPSSHLARAWFPTEGASVNQVTFSKHVAVGGQGTHHLNYWVVTSLTGDFTVDHISLTLAGTESSASGAVTQTPGKTALFGSYSCSDTDQTEYGSQALTARLDGTNAVIERAATDGAIDWRGSAVTFTDDTNVYRGSETITAATEAAESGSHAVAIGASVDASRTSVGPSGTMGTVIDGRGDATVDEHNSPGVGASYRLVGDPATTFNIVRFDSSSDHLDRTYEWQVIEWGTGAAGPAPPRRFLVRA